MSRNPTSRLKLYAWWKTALAARGRYASLREAAEAGVEIPEIPSDDPQCGFYSRRMVRGGLYVPARIFMHQIIDRATGDLLSDEVLVCEIGGKAYPAGDQWQWLANKPISQEEFEYGAGFRRWHIENSNGPRPSDFEPVDWAKAPPPKFKRRSTIK